MRVVVTVLARDEADIIDDQVAFHLNAGADFVIATDNNSRDGTTAIFERYARDGVLHLIREPAEGLRQGEWVTRMARLAAEEYGADWVINTDADEFWWPRGGSLKEVLGAVPQEYGVVQGFWRSFVPQPDDGQPFAERMTARLAQHAPINDPTSFYRPVVKVAHRADPHVTVARGNHALADSSFSTLSTWHPIEVLHFPLRSQAQWMRKVELQGDAFTKHIERSGTGYHLKGYDALQRGRIDEQHASLVVDDAALEHGVQDGTLVIDTRLRDALRAIRAGNPLTFPAPTLADDAAYAVEAASLTEAYAVRAQRQLDGIEQRLLGLERQ
jgi:Glycosyl transferase family 2